MTSETRNYWKIFVSTFLLSAFTFGGGYVIVTLMRKKFVEEYKWIEAREMLDLVAIAQSSPGVIAINTSIIVGYRLAGVPGSLVAILGAVLPPLITLSVISYFYIIFKESAIINAILKGMSAGVAAVVADIAARMGKDITNEKSIFSVIIMIFSFMAVFLAKIDIKIIIFACGLSGLVHAFIHRMKGKEAGN